MSTLDFTRLREALAYNPDTGVFTWKIRAASNTHIGDVAGCPRPNSGYIRISLDGGMYYAHRLAWGYMYGVWPTGQIDHINGVRTDNSLRNLRDVSATANNHNLHKKPRNRTGFAGVGTTRGGRYVASIKSGGEYRHLGVFDTPSQAHTAYIHAKQKHLPSKDTSC